MCHFQSLRILFVFNIVLILVLSSQCWFGLTQIYTYICVLSSTAFTYSYVFLLESFFLSEYDRTLSSSMLLPQILSIQIICILLKPSNVFSASLSAKDIETKIEFVLNAISLLPETRRSRNDHPIVQACVGTWNNFQCVACLPRVPQMWTTRGTCVIALCCPFPYKYTSHRGQNPSPPLHLAQTLAPPLALDDIDDEALSCRELTDAVLTPAADLVSSAAVVGVFHRQVRAREIELLGLPLHSI